MNINCIHILKSSKSKKIFVNLLFLGIGGMLVGCTSASSALSEPVKPPRYLEMGEKTSPIYGPGGFTEARQEEIKNMNSKGSR
ncbi:hypothetical protein [Salinisphaera orenii]|uniref:hypothetical protein n=1 Tax=Salinisphaera orenii TaxID=856731 RepID=UPI0013A6122E